jgi:hypothetical protein
MVMRTLACIAGLLALSLAQEAAAAPAPSEEAQAPPESPSLAQFAFVTGDALVVAPQLPLAIGSTTLATRRPATSSTTAASRSTPSAGRDVSEPTNYDTRAVYGNGLPERFAAAGLFSSRSAT